MSETTHSKIETIKAHSHGLSGSIGQELVGDDDDSFSEDSAQLLKFHGVYQQDDRDVRRDRKQQGLGLDHIFMVRVAVPGGSLTADQYLAMDLLADAVGNGTLRITTRQGIQFHFVRKGDLHALISTLNDQLVTTLAACGDVVRNTMCCPAPLPDRRRAEVGAYAQRVAERFRPRTDAYYQLWVDGEPAVTAERHEEPEEPLYGTTYLPRKFKIGFAFPGDNCVDVYTNDVGVVPVLDDAGSLTAFTVLVGGGLGKSHTNADTFPRLADPLTTVAPEALLELLEAIIGVQRDHGDRNDRAHARMKYLVHDWGIDRFRAAVEERLGDTLPDPELVSVGHVDDHLGWHAQGDGRWFLGVKVENGRVADRNGHQVRSGLREVVERFSPGVRLTPRGDVLLTGLAAGDRAEVDAMLRDHGVRPAEQWVAIERNAAACPALPTCGLALTESERALPGVLEVLQAELDHLGLGSLDIHVRMTGCPNGCSRPYTAEIGFVGRGKKNYDIHLGGEPAGRRLNQVFAENVPRDELVNVLRPVLTTYRDDRGDGEGLGDYCERVGVNRLRASHGNEQWTRRRRGAAKTV